MPAMPEDPGPNLRLLAPVAVGVFAVAMVVVLLTSGALSSGGSAETAGSSSGDEREKRSEPRRERRERSSGPASYTVQAGDTLGSIADDNEVSVERLQELNPDLDPQVLTAGQRIRLRE